MEPFWGCEIRFIGTTEQIDKWYNKNYSILNSSGVHDFRISYKYIHESCRTDNSNCLSCTDRMIQISFPSPLTWSEIAKFLEIPNEMILRVSYMTKPRYLDHEYDDIYSYEGVKSNTKSAAKITKTIQT